MPKRSVFIIPFIIVCMMFICEVHVCAASDYELDREVIYRMYNPNSGEHLYTSSAPERQHLYMVGWDAEDIGWVAPGESSTPIYRLYNGFEHLYTKDYNEAEYLSVNGWSNEGIKFYSNDNMTLAMYRLYNPFGGEHHYTTNTIERDSLVSLGWNNEGIAWYTLNVDTSSIVIPALPERYQSNITNTDSYATIEADVKLSGTGSGNHAKLVYQTPTAAVSFGIQYDRWAQWPYTDTVYYLCENVASNDPGAQRYHYFDYTNKDRYHHLMMTYKVGGHVDFYVDGNWVGYVDNPQLSEGQLYVSVEGSARLDGDSVDASFKNIRLKSNGYYDANRSWPTYSVITNPGIAISHTGFDASAPGTGSVHISGTISGLGGLDWDSAYDRVSGVMRLSNPL